MEKHYIYKLTSPSGKLYIGRTEDFHSRMYQHKCRAKKNHKHPLYDSIRKHGWENFTKEILAEVQDTETAYDTELHYIILLDTVNNGLNVMYNTRDGGNVWKGKKGTPEYDAFVEKMKIINAGTKNGMFGKLHTEESKELQKAAAVGRYSLDWFIQRHGPEDGQIKYEERRAWLKSRNLKKDANGKFIKG